mmetsp:Transcript_6771/g.16011  ORF Transcript_6771/g.16011 Transcript_6771/m.16011 type:complete len:311 (-) Transcript_6771:678-1610(-)
MAESSRCSRIACRPRDWTPPRRCGTHQRELVVTSMRSQGSARCGEPAGGGGAVDDCPRGELCNGQLCPQPWHILRAYGLRQDWMGSSWGHHSCRRHVPRHRPPAGPRVREAPGRGRPPPDLRRRRQGRRRARPRRADDGHLLPGARELRVGQPDRAGQLPRPAPAGRRQRLHRGRQLAPVPGPLRHPGQGVRLRLPDVGAVHIHGVRHGHRLRLDASGVGPRRRALPRRGPSALLVLAGALRCGCASVLAIDLPEHQFSVRLRCRRPEWLGTMDRLCNHLWRSDLLHVWRCGAGPCPGEHRARLGGAAAA